MFRCIPHMFSNFPYTNNAFYGTDANGENLREKSFSWFRGSTKQKENTTDTSYIKGDQRHTLNSLCLFNDAIVNYIPVAFVIRGQNRW